MATRPKIGKRESSNDTGVSPPPAKRKHQSATTSKAVANFFTPTSKKEPDKMSWRIVKDSLLIGRHAASTPLKQLQGSKRKVAAFDLDSTLILPSSGRTFAKDATDWKWWHASVPGTLKSLHEEGYLVAIFSNQGGISLKPDPKTVKSDQKRLADFKCKVSAILTQLDLPLSVYAATSRDGFRKPRIGMWKELVDDHDLDADGAIDLENSIFVGDAGGRGVEAGAAVKDHSCVDRDFAANVGLTFHTPEEYFLHEKPRPFTREFDPTAYLRDRAENILPALCFAEADAVGLILFCGSPGAGKSSFYWRQLQSLGYGRVNQDLLKTREKCVKAAIALIEAGTSVVVDNTNADPETRQVWIKLAHKLNVPIRCVLFTASVRLCEHNDTVRALNIGTENNPENRTILPKLAFTGFASRYREPQLAEGFLEIAKVDFEFEGADEFKSIWTKYWL